MFGDTPLVLVEDAAALAEMVERLRGEPVIGVDTESDGFHRFRERVSLIQLSGPDRDYIVDPLALEAERGGGRDRAWLGGLSELLANPAQVKVLHGADYDVVSLRRDFGVQINNLFDTMIASQFLNIQEFGLAHLIKRYFGYTLDKRYQRHDWSERPLLPEHLDYARGDTHFLIALREILLVKLERAGRRGPVEEECAVLVGRQWQGRTRDPNDFLRIKGANDLDEGGLRLLRALWNYREEQGERMDRPVFKVIPDEVLLMIAARAPEQIGQIDAAFRLGSPLLRRHRQGLWQAVQQGRADDEPLPERQARAASQPHALSQNMGEALLVKLREWRNREMSRQGLPAVAVLSNQHLKSLVRCAPTTPEELEQVPDLRRWQIETFGEDVLEVIREVVGAAPPPKKKRRRKRATA